MRFIILVSLLIGFGASAKSYKKGKLETFVVDFHPQGSRVEYYLDEEGTGKKLRVRFDTEPDSVIPSGTRVSIGGTHDAASAELRVSSKKDVTVVAPAPVAPVSGTRDVIAILLNFDNANVAYDAPTVHAKLFDPTNSVHATYLDASFNQLGFTGQVVGPFAIATSGTSCDYGTWSSLANQAAAANGINVGDYNHVMYLLPQTSCQWAGLGEVPGRRTWIQGGYATHVGVTAHELGHNLGMHHASAGGSEYGDSSDLMGGAGSWPITFNSAHKDQMAWIPTVPTVASGTYTLTTIDGGSAQAVKVRLGSTSTYYHISFRTPAGYNSRLGSGYAYKTNIHTHSGGATRTNFITSLSDGQVFTDSANGIQITQVSSDTASSTITVSASGSAPPTAPTGLTASPISTSQINLGWADNSSNESGFKIERSPDGVSFSQIATVGANIQSYASTGLSASTRYHYRVRAYNASGDSGYSNTADAITQTPPPDTTPPSVSLTTPANGATISGVVAVTASASDNVGVSRVEFYADSVLIGSDSSSPYGINVDTSTLSSGSHTLSAKAYDGAGNSGDSSVISVTVNHDGGGDTQPPSVPTNLACTKTRVDGRHELRCSWGASTDNVGVQFYELYRDDNSAPFATSTGTSYQGSFSPGTYRVKAVDASGNRSPFSNASRIGGRSR